MFLWSEIELQLRNTFIVDESLDYFVYWIVVQSRDRPVPISVTIALSNMNPFYDVVSVF